MLSRKNRGLSFGVHKGAFNNTVLEVPPAACNSQCVDRLVVPAHDGCCAPEDCGIKAAKSILQAHELLAEKRRMMDGSRARYALQFVLRFWLIRRMRGQTCSGHR